MMPLPPPDGVDKAVASRLKIYDVQCRKDNDFKGYYPRANVRSTGAKRYLPPYDKNDCKEVTTRRTLDKTRRLLLNVHGSAHCHMHDDAMWDETVLEPIAGVEKGACWSSNKHAMCNTWKSVKTCNVDDTCTWVASKYVTGCVVPEVVDNIKDEEVPDMPEDWPEDITNSDHHFQTYLANYFGYLTKKAPIQVAQLTANRNRCVSAGPSIMKPSLSQGVVNMTMRGLKSRGLLAWHSTGSGKTCTATGVMEAFWETDKRIIYLSSVEAIRSNPPNKFHECAHNFFPRFKSGDIKGSFEKRKVEYITFARLCNILYLERKPPKTSDPKLKKEIDARIDYLKNAVLIIDEVHNIFKPLPNQRKKHTLLKEFLLRRNEPRTSDLKIVILTATPGDTPSQVIELLNMIHDQSKPPLQVPDTTNMQSLREFIDNIAGMISYIDLSRDTSKFPVYTDKSTMKAPMTSRQYAKYIEKWREMPVAEKNFKKLQTSDKMASYMATPRKYSNMMYDLEKDIEVIEFSSKFAMLQKQIAAYPIEKHYVYSSFYENRGYGGHGAMGIGKLIEKTLGIEKLTVELAMRIAKQGNLDNIKKQNRYVLVTNSELGGKSKSKTRAQEALSSILFIYNHEANRHGDYIRIMVASNNYNEGLDLKAVKHIHMFEPLLTLAMEQQTIGRAVRQCSHAHLPKEDWNMTLHRYFADKPMESNLADVSKLKLDLDVLNKMKPKTDDSKKRAAVLRKEIKLLESTSNANVQMVDELIYKEARDRVSDLMAIFDCMRRAAIDCKLTRSFHGNMACAIP